MMLQKIYRIKRFEKQMRAGLNVKNIRGFVALSKNRQLLGAIKILLGIYPEPIEESSVVSYSHEIMYKVLHGPATKVQSIFKMHRYNLFSIIVRSFYNIFAEIAVDISIYGKPCILLLKISLHYIDIWYPWMIYL